MFLLLPEEQKNKLIKQYRLRLFFIALSALCVFVGVGFFSLLPSYFAVHSEEDNIVGLRNTVGKSISLKSDKDLEKTLSDIKQNISALKIPEKDAISIIGDIVKVRPDGVRLNDINFGSYTATSSAVSILGVSSDRPSLILFSRKLKENPKFSSVDLPISNLAKDSDINFNINIALNI